MARRSHSFAGPPRRAVYTVDMACLLVWPLLIGILAGAPGDGPRGAVGAAVPMVRVRTASPQLRALVDDTAARSVTVRALLAHLDRTDVIVYLEATGSPQIPTARTKLVTTVPGARFIRIGINTGVAFADLAPFLAHELQHAVEIAQRHDVRDEGAVRALYLAIGRARGGDRFETDAAQAVERTVRSELRAKIGG